MTDRPEPRSMTPEERDAKILELLLAGHAGAHVARELSVSRNTVAAVRERPDVQPRLAAARAARAAALEEGLEDARRVLREGASAAAQALVDGINDDDPNVRLRAAAQLLDRIGVPRVEEVRNRSVDLPDLSKLSDEELAQWEELNAKVSPR